MGEGMKLVRFGYDVAMAGSVLLIVDMLSPYDFPGAGQVADGAENVVEKIVECRRQAKGAGLEVIFANDIGERFSGSREEIYRDALDGQRPELVRPLEPASEDRFLHKGQHSAFYGTPLAHLLHEWDIERIVLTGQVTEQCILYTALDAHVRHYDVTVLRDCVLDLDPELGMAALRMMESNMGAEIIESREWVP